MKMRLLQNVFLLFQAAKKLWLCRVNFPYLTLCVLQCDYCTWANCTIYCAALMWIEVSVWPFDERKLSWSYIMFLWTCLSILEERSRRKVLSLWWCEGYFWADLSWCDVMVGTWMYLSWIFIQWSLLSPGICIILVHLLIKFKLHFLPESVAVVSLGKFCLRSMLLCIA